ncbi:hypothetical protein Tco_1184604 [Tanacetum coccineum]
MISSRDEYYNKYLTHQVSRGLVLLPNGLFDLISDEDSTNEDGDIGVSVSLGGEIFSEGKESRESNIGESDNTRDGGKTTVDLIGDEDSTNEDGDIGVLVSLGGEIFSEGKESRESNIGDSDNTRDGGKTVGRVFLGNQEYVLIKPDIVRECVEENDLNIERKLIWGITSCITDTIIENDSKETFLKDTDSYYLKQYGKQYYHREQLNASLMGRSRSDIWLGTDVPVKTNFPRVPH